MESLKDVPIEVLLADREHYRALIARQQEEPATVLEANQRATLVAIQREIVRRSTIPPRLG